MSKRAKKRPSKTRGRRRRRRPRAPAAGGGREPREWVGGRVRGPFYITEPEPYRPELIIWLELPERFVVGQALVGRDEPSVSLGQALIEAARSPMIGPPRRPPRVRVASAALAGEVHQVAPEIEVVVAPTPEIDEIVAAMVEHTGDVVGDEPPSYFEGGRVSHESVARLFRAAEQLYRLEPWSAPGGDVLRLDIPELGVQGACVTIIGAMGESLGLVLFPSLLAYERFVAASEEGDGFRRGALDVGTTVLSLNFERATELPSSMRREAAEHGWPVAGTRGYPRAEARDTDGTPRPLSQRDVDVVTACAGGIASFFVRHRALFELDDPEASIEPACESYLDEDDLEVRLTMPYEAAELFEAEPAMEATEPAAPQRQGAGDPGPRVGRNQPCPCGSGQKYKRCCLDRDRQAASMARAPAAAHAMDERLVEAILSSAVRRFGEQVLTRSAKLFGDPDLALPLLTCWAAYGIELDGKTAAAHYLAEQRRRLSGSERSWLEAQQATWLSVWEVVQVDAGRSLVLEDLLTGERRTVLEVSGSRNVLPRLALLARVIDHEGISLLGGSHPRPLPPIDAAEVVRRVRGRLRRKRAVPAERLRGEKIGRYLIARWEEQVDEHDARGQARPRLQNTDGEELLLTVDHFELCPGARADVERRLAALPDVRGPVALAGEADGVETAAGEALYEVTRPGNAMHDDWEDTLVGRAIFTEAKLQLETNSIERADALRAQLEAACGQQVRHRAREHTDPTSTMQDRGEGAFGGQDLDDGPAPPEVAAAILAMKRKHYAGWIDTPLPALDGRTPRQASTTREGREQLDVLLKDCELHEALIDEDQRFDWSLIRGELGLNGR